MSPPAGLEGEMGRGWVTTRGKGEKGTAKGKREGEKRTEAKYGVLQPTSLCKDAQR